MKERKKDSCKELTNMKTEDGETARKGKVKKKKIQGKQSSCSNSSNSLKVLPFSKGNKM